MSKLRGCICASRTERLPKYRDDNALRSLASRFETLQYAAAAADVARFLILKSAKPTNESRYLWDFMHTAYFASLWQSTWSFTICALLLDFAHT